MNRLLALIISASIILSACVSSSQSQIQASATQVQGLEKGNVPPDFSVVTIDGKTIRLSEYAGQKPVLIYFFATWCPYCRVDFEALKDHYPAFADSVEIVAIDLDLSEGKELITAYRDEGTYSWNFAPATSHVLDDYHVQRTTTKYAVGKSGTIIWKGSGDLSGAQWRTLLNLLKDSR